jgi:phospholipid-binding lipoprotein MlaA
MSPIGYVVDSGTANALQPLQLVEVRAQLLPMDQARREAYDEYAFVRDAWAQHRRYQLEEHLHGDRN